MHKSLCQQLKVALIWSLALTKIILTGLFWYADICLHEENGLLSHSISAYMRDVQVS